MVVFQLSPLAVGVSEYEKTERPSLVKIPFARTNTKIEPRIENQEPLAFYFHASGCGAAAWTSHMKIDR
jgi:hypothetical protein